MTPIRILVVDDQVLFRDGVAHMLATQEDLVLVGEAGDGDEALEKVRSLRPDVVLMDVQMPRLNGLEATKLIRREFPEVRVVILTVSDEDEDLFSAIKAGAVGYLLKNLRANDLFDSLRGVVDGEAALSPVVAERVLEEFASRPPGAPAPAAVDLTDRERQVLQLVINGASNRDIAADLEIAESTVKRHLHNILEKLHLENRGQAAAYAVRKGIIELPTD